MKMGDRIRQMRIDAGMTQEELAEKLGLQKSAIAKYENGRVENIKRSTIQKMAELFDRTPSYVMGFTDTSDYNSDNSSAPIVRIPVLGYVAAGIPIEEIEDIVDWEEIPKDWLRGGKKYFALRIAETPWSQECMTEMSSLSRSRMTQKPESTS